MLSVEEVKTILNDPKLSEKELEEIRDGFYLLVEVIFEQWQAERTKTKNQNENENGKSIHNQ